MAGDGERTTRTIDGHEISLSSPEKVIYPETGMTKAEVAAYYEAIAPVLLPQLRDRVVTRIRYPEGVGGAERFYEKNAPSFTPDWIRVFGIRASPGDASSKLVRFPVIDDVAGLLWMANLNALEHHTPQWRLGPRGGVRNPDRLVLDLDPGEGVGMEELAEIACLVRDRFAEDDVALTPVTSGGKGIHLYGPVKGKTWQSVHAHVRDVARALAEEYPERVVAVQAKEQRAGKVMIDWSQNHPSRSTATPYTLRGKPAPTVAAPRAWNEIGPDLAQLGPDEVLSRIEKNGDFLQKAGLR